MESVFITPPKNIKTNHVIPIENYGNRSIGSYELELGYPFLLKKLEAFWDLQLIINPKSQKVILNGFEI